METKNSIEQNENYVEIINFFGTAKKAATHFDISVQSIYQWRVEGVPKTRMRELNLLKKVGAENVC